MIAIFKFSASGGDSVFLLWSRVSLKEILGDKEVLDEAYNEWYFS